MYGRLPASIATLLTSVFLLGLAGPACMEEPRRPASGGGGSGGEDEPGDTGGKKGGSPDATGGKGGSGAGGAVATGGADGTGGATGTGGAKGTGGSTGTGGSPGKADAGSDSGTAAGDAGAATPTFTEVYRRVMAMEPDVIASSCWGPCHAGPGVAKAMQKIDMTTQEKAYPGVMKLVMPGNAQRSKLWMELNSGAMPEKKPKLPAALIKLVADWINAGAKND